jgi:hypothetical protein
MVRHNVLAVKELSKDALILVWLWLGAVLQASTQVTVSIPQRRYHRYEKIDVIITNRTAKPMSFCVEFGHRSMRGSGAGDVEATPTPVYVQRKMNGKWSTLVIGPDIGSVRHSVVVEPGEAQHYPFRLIDRGQMRLVLDYWRGERDDPCANPKGRKVAKSNVFDVE